MDSGNVRVCSGILGLACLLQTMPYGMCGANLKALGAMIAISHVTSESEKAFRAFAKNDVACSNS